MLEVDFGLTRPSSHLESPVLGMDIHYSAHDDDTRRMTAEAFAVTGRIFGSNKRPLIGSGYGC